MSRINPTKPHRQFSVCLSARSDPASFGGVGCYKRCSRTTHAMPGSRPRKRVPRTPVPPLMSELNPSTHNHDCGPLDCKAVIDQLWEYLDGELGEERTMLIRQHLALCSHCYPQYDFEK